MEQNERDFGFHNAFLGFRKDEVYTYVKNLVNEKNGEISRLKEENKALHKSIDDLSSEIDQYKALVAESSNSRSAILDEAAEKPASEGPNPDAPDNGSSDKKIVLPEEDMLLEEKKKKTKKHKKEKKKNKK